MITPIIMLTSVLAFNGLYLWNKYPLWDNGYKVWLGFGLVSDTSKMFELARKTENNRLRRSYTIRGWLIPLMIPVLVIMFYNISWTN